MCGRESVGHTGQQLRRLAPGALFLFDPGVESSAVDELGYEVLSALEIAGVVDSQDVRVVERGGHLCLSLKAAARGAVRQLGGQELDRHRPAELGIDGTKHFTHAAGAEESFNLVSSHLGAWHDHGRCRIRAGEPGHTDKMVRGPGLR